MMKNERFELMEPYVEVFRQLIEANLIMGFDGRTYERCTSHYKGFLIEKSLGNTIDFDNTYNKERKTMTYWKRVDGFFQFKFTYEEIISYFEFEKEYEEYSRFIDEIQRNTFDDFYSNVSCEELYH